MKRIVSLVMVLAMMLSLVACGGNSNTVITEATSAPLEHVSVETLFESLGNGAKAKSHEGKETTVFGRVVCIDETSCTVELFMKNQGVSLSLPTEILIELNSDDCIAAKATVKEYLGNTSYCKYALEADSLLDNTEVVNNIRTLMDSYMEKYSDASAVSCALHDEVNLNGILRCVQANPHLFHQDDAKLQEIVTGSWVKGFEGQRCEFRANNTYHWTYQEQSYGTKKWYDREQDGDWSVSNGTLSSFMGFEPQTVYVLSDDVFICMNILFVRVK